MTHLRILLLLFFLLSPVVAEPTRDKAALLSFLSKVPHESRLEWSATASACTWVGVTCDAARTTVIALRLPGVGLLGPIPPNTLSQLTSLRVISLRSNSLSGPIPSDLSNLSVLHALYLQHNSFSGEIPPEVGSMERLTRLDLSNNDLDGKIPFGISNLSRLTGLFLQDNNFSGGIPSLDFPALVDFNVSNNRLNGSVPRSMDRFPVSAFSGNLNLCGGPLTPCPPFFSSPAPAPALVGVVAKKNTRKLSKAAIIAISVVAGGILLAALLLLFVIVFRRRKNGGKKEDPKAVGGAVAGEASTSKEAERNKLVFLENGVYGFDLEDLLRASAEVLGKGSVGTSYKAVLEEGTTVVVKRLKDVVASKREFEVHMEEIGKVKHPNVVPIRAFYYSKDEKLLVSDYLAAGSLSALLHGSRGSGRTPLDWDNRLHIALAAGRGLVHLHHSARVVHGNIKALNVLLRAEPEAAAFSDFGLSPLFGTAVPTNRVAGYCAPEVLETRRPTYKSDIYSFGVLLLELLTGKAPSQTSLGEEGIDLPRWVQSVVREEWTAEVFDVELMRSGQNVEEEMVQLLQLAMACVSQVPDSRPGILEVVKMMEEIVSRREEEYTMRPYSDDRSGGPTPPAASTP